MNGINMSFGCPLKCVNNNKKKKMDVIKSDNIKTIQFNIICICYIFILHAETN